MEDRRKESAPSGWDHPFWRLMGFVFAGLLSIAIWVGKSTVDKLQSINDTQIEMKVQLTNLLSQVVQDQARFAEQDSKIRSLEISDSLHQQDLNELKARTGLLR